MASAEPHKIFLISEILELILLETDMRTLLTSAQRVCRKWHDLIQDSGDLQAALFFKPVRYELPRGTQGIRNPLLEEYIWPWFCARQAREWKPPPIEGGTKIPQIEPQSDRLFLRNEASWQRMLFQQPPRSCIGIVEKDGWVVDGPAYTEVKVQPKGGVLRIRDVAIPCFDGVWPRLHPLLEVGILWYGVVPKPNMELERYGVPLTYGDLWRHGELQRDQVAYATSIYLRDCDIVFFTQECASLRGHYNSGVTGMVLNCWLYHLGQSLVPRQTSIPMPVT